MLKKANKNKKRRGAVAPAALLSSIGVGLALCTVTLILTTLLMSALLLAADDPNALIIPAALCALYISSMAGGAAASYLRRGDSSAALCLGGAEYMIILILSLLLPGGMGEKIDVLPAAALVAPCLLFAFFGGLAMTSALTRKKKRSSWRR